LLNIFIFLIFFNKKVNVESVGAIPPQRLLPDAVKVLIEKCKVLKRSLAQLNQNN